MTVTYILGDNPKWYIADKVGRPLAGGYLATFSNLDKTLLKPVYQDIAGTLIWPYVGIPNIGKPGILFAENGSQGPFYFKFDSAFPNDTYYLEVYDSDGVLQWTISDYSPGSGTGGSVVTTALDLENLIVNNVFYRNLGETPVPLTTYMMLAPGANAGLADTPVHAGPDINFIKTNTSATDVISFPKFPIGIPPFTTDIAPVDCLKYTCTGAGTGELEKSVQIPITSGVRNLANTAVTLTIWARGASGATTLILYWYQFFGDGPSASASVKTPIQTLNLTSSWTKFSIQTTVPSIATKVIGQCGNDGLFLLIQFALDATTDVELTKPCLFIGNVSPTQTYETYDQIDAVINSPRTGDTRTSLNNFAPFGWVKMDDGSIGSPTSSATNRANIDTFPLYNLIYNSVLDAWAPVSGGRTGNAVNDFVANKSIQLTRALGRVFAGTLNTEVTQTFTTNFAVNNQLTVSSVTSFNNGVPVQLTTTGTLPAPLNVNTTYYVISVDSTHIKLSTTPTGTEITLTSDGTGVQTIQVTPFVLGQYLGEETHVLTVDELAAHTHPPLNGIGFDVKGGAGGGDNFVAGTQNATQSTTGSTGLSTPHNTLQPTTYMNVFIKL